MLPEVNLWGEVSKDQGAGFDAYRPTEYALGLYLSVPLFFREGRGRSAEAISKKLQTEARQQWLTLKLSAESESALREIRATQDVLVLRQDALELAKKVENAERKRFQTGAADLIDVNIREESAALAAVDVVEARRHFLESLIDLWVASGEDGFKKLTRKYSSS
jgi:outer membrane protein TolC